MRPALRGSQRTEDCKLKMENEKRCGMNEGEEEMRCC